MINAGVPGITDGAAAIVASLAVICSRWVTGVPVIVADITVIVAVVAGIIAAVAIFVAGVAFIVASIAVIEASVTVIVAGNVAGATVSVALAWPLALPLW